MCDIYHYGRNHECNFFIASGDRGGHYVNLKPVGTKSDVSHHFLHPWRNKASFSLKTEQLIGCLAKVSATAVSTIAASGKHVMQKPFIPIYSGGQKFSDTQSFPIESYSVQVMQN